MCSVFDRMYFYLTTITNTSSAKSIAMRMLTTRAKRSASEFGRRACYKIVN